MGWSLFARRIGWLALVIAAAYAGLQIRILGAIAGVAAVGALFVATTLWLPRAAHAAFAAGKLARAARRYWLAGATTWSASRWRAARLSRASCALAAGDLARSDALLAALAEDALDLDERAVYLNNRAVARLAAADAAAGTEALALADRAGALRPDVPAIQHTRAVALLAVGRVDDALHVLDQMRLGGELAPRLEAERCGELATAWEKKGQLEYADDYRRRAAALKT